MSLVLLTLAVLAPSFASQCRLPPCCCNGQAGVSDTRDRPDYGTRCARWDAPDEEPWCIVDKAACGDDTFSSDGGHYWSHVPCGGLGDDFVPDSKPPDTTPDDADRDGAAHSGESGSETDADGIAYSDGAYGAIDLKRPETLVPFDDLPKADVVAAVKALLGAEKVAEIEQALETRISEKIAPTRFNAVPSSWSE